jgi:WD40 repeat protein
MRDFEVADGELWTASNDGTVRVHSLDGRERLVIGTSSLTEPTITGPDDPNAKLPPNPHGARFIAFAPDGVRVATTYEDGRIVLRDRTTGAELATWTGHTGRVRALIFDGKVAYSVGDTTVRKWDATTGAELAHGDLHGNGWTVAVRGDVVLTQTDRDDLALWSAATLSPGATPAVAKDRLRDFAFVDDRVLVADAEQLGVLDIHTGKFARVVAFANPFSSDLGAETIAMGTTHAEISILDRATLETLRSWRLGEGIVTTVKLRPDGKILASAGPNNVRIWDPATGALLAERTDFPTMIMRIEWTPDGDHLVIMGAAATVWLWDLTPATPVASCITPWTLADSTLAPAPHTSTWCAPTPR